MSATLAVLRPEPGNAATVARAQAAGFATLSLPLFRVAPLAWQPPDAGDHDALILTSANALRCGGPALETLRGLPVYAVGAQTAAAARGGGFDVVAVGERDAAALLALAETRGVARALHLTGRDRMLAEGGVLKTVIAVYDSVARALDADALRPLAGTTALLHSARAARRLGEAIDAARIDRTAIAVAAFAPAIAEAAGSGWGGIAIAASPDDAALFAAIAPSSAPVDPPAARGDKVRMDVSAPHDPLLGSDPVAPAVDPTPRATTAARERIGWRAGIALGILAFLAGLAAMALVAVRFGASFAPSGTAARPVATLTVPVGPNGTAPVVIVPGKAAAAVPAIDLAALSARETELAAQLAALEARAGSIDQSSVQASRYATRAEGLMVAFAARRALDRGLGLGFIEDQLRTRFGTSQPRAVATIVQAAREPVTLEDLRAGIDGVAPELMTGAGNTGWLASLRRELGNLVVLRRAGTPSPLPVDRVARARRLLDAGQVEAALAEVARTPGAAGAERWTQAARRYIDTRVALDTIESTAILTPETPPAPPAAGFLPPGR